jgi:3-hydroxyacyl-CoA dehydrogenase
LSEVIALLDRIEKPTIAAIRGVALGGGLELALALHFRVADPDAKLGLPEVRIGILPGAGGTQRLPRAIGMLEALKMIVTGDPVGARRAHGLGLVDALAEGDVTAEAVAFARKVIAEQRPIRRLRDRTDKLAYEPAAFEETAGALTRRARGLEAPLACVKAVRDAATLPFDEGVKAERESFMRLLAGDQSNAQRHVFFAERAARKVPDMPPSVMSRRVDHVAIIGGGTMGRGIALSFADAGIPATVIETTEAALAKCMAAIEDTYKQAVARGRLSEADAQKRIGFVNGTISMESGVKDVGVGDCRCQRPRRGTEPHHGLCTGDAARDGRSRFRTE